MNETDLPGYSSVCMDCSIETIESGEYYMVHDDIWHTVTKANKDGRGMLCLDCLENRLGRSLTLWDFPMKTPLNADEFPYLKKRLESLRVQKESPSKRAVKKLIAWSAGPRSPHRFKWGKVEFDLLDRPFVSNSDDVREVAFEASIVYGGKDRINQSWIEVAYTGGYQETLAPITRDSIFSSSFWALPAGIDASNLKEIVSAGRRALALKHHPDRGGSEEQMKALNVAADWLEEQVRRL